MKTRVLIVGFTGGVGGVESFILNLCKNIDYSKFEIEFLMHQKINKKYEKDIENLNIKINYVKGIKKNPFKFLINIFRFFKKNKYDVIHLNECSASFFVYVLPILFNKKTKFIVHSHNGNSNSRIFHYLLRGIQNRRSNAKWVCSDKAAKWMFGKKKDFKLIHNGIIINDYIFSNKIRDSYRKEYGLDDKIVLGSVARFNQQKNHKKMLDIFEEYHKINKDSVLILIGDGELKTEIQNKVHEKELDEFVLFLGIRDDVKNFMMAFDIFLLPSLFEGLPFVTIEAQAASLPIISSNTVSSQIAMTDLVYFESLDKSSTEWAEKIDIILKNKINRTSTVYYEMIKQNGYDIKDVSKFIMTEYNNKE